VDGRDSTQVEKTVVERGCIYKKKVNGISVSFPGKSDSCPGASMCDRTLTEENYGNVGTIKAKYETKVASDNPSGFPTGNGISWNKIGLHCHQCQTPTQASALLMVSLLILPPLLFTPKRFIPKFFMPIFFTPKNFLRQKSQNMFLA